MNNNNIEDSVYLTDNSIYGNKIKKVTPEGKESDVGISDVMYDNIIQSGINSTIDLSGINSLSQQATTRNEMYNIYDTMCEDGQISAVIKTYAEDATQRNAEGNIVWATSNDSNIAYLINYYIDSLNIDKNIYKWAYSLCKYGDLYIRLYRESEYDDAIFGKKNRNLTEDVKIKAFKKNDKYAHYVEMVTNPAEMFELTKELFDVVIIKSRPSKGIISITPFELEWERKDVLEDIYGTRATKEFFLQELIDEMKKPEEDEEEVLDALPVTEKDKLDDVKDELPNVIHKEYDYFVYSELDKSNERFLRKQENTDKSKEYMWGEPTVAPTKKPLSTEPDLFSEVQNESEQSELPF